jgi:hypothetical protein
MMTTGTELRDLIVANHAAVSQQIAVGFAQIDTKMVQIDTKISNRRGEVNTWLAEMKVTVQGGIVILGTIAERGFQRIGL